MTTRTDYLYSYKYDTHYTELCKLEMRQVFGFESNDKVLFSNKKVDPSSSPFIKGRMKVLFQASDYYELLSKVENENIHKEDFAVDYMILEGDSTAFDKRRIIQKDFGYRIEGEPDFQNPGIVFGVCFYDQVWYFGLLTHHNSNWQKHNQKPCSFSNSISINIAKSLVSMASMGNKGIKLLDACCGVGTIMLEACFAGIDIEGCDINWRACKHSRENLEFFHYKAKVYRSDIKELKKTYDAAIVDLPYNLYSYSNDDIALNIIESTAQLSHRIIVVSIADIEEILYSSGLKILDYCTVEKKGKSTFSRKLWVCERG